ncbi:MAG: DUF2071 domain-containing protein [Chloroflexi bacterium]|nr:DUF2071 domain-containing protein [Chloroflexota bacterium]
MTSQIYHRPWPLPTRRWIMRQSWHDLLFAHWPVPVEQLRPLVPAQLPLDTYDGSAWVGVVPFRMTGVVPRWTPPVPWLSAFPELNVRTYVNIGDRPGVYFFSLDAGNAVAVSLARLTFQLPYFHARMRLVDAGHAIHYFSRRIHRGAPAAEFVASYRSVGDVFRSIPGTLDHWLTERYCLYTVDSRGHIHRGEIHHPPWPLQPAEADIETNTMAAAHAIRLPDIPPLLHYARRLDVVVWAPENVN